MTKIIYNNDKGITLIGMPGAGKSGVGKIIAEMINWQFIDLDKLILKTQGITHHEYMKQFGEESLKNLEEKLTLGLNLKNTIYAPPGSMIYWKPEIIEKIKKESIVVYLQAEPETIEKRLGERLYKNGIIGLEEKGFANLMAERVLLYEKYADHIFHTGNQSKEEMANKVLVGLNIAS